MQMCLLVYEMLIVWFIISILIPKLWLWGDIYFLNQIKANILIYDLKMMFAVLIIKINFSAEYAILLNMINGNLINCMLYDLLLILVMNVYHILIFLYIFLPKMIHKSL